MAEEKTTVRFAFDIPVADREHLGDCANLLRMEEGELVRSAINAYLHAVAEKKGEKFQTAIKVLREARED